MDEKDIPVSMDEFNSPDFPEKRKQKEEEGYVFNRDLSGSGTAATFSSAGSKLPDVVILAGHFVLKK